MAALAALRQQPQREEALAGLQALQAQVCWVCRVCRAGPNFIVMVNSHVAKNKKFALLPHPLTSPPFSKSVLCLHKTAHAQLSGIQVRVNLTAMLLIAQNYRGIEKQSSSSQKIVG